ncbi:amidohydrolase family protein [Streptomyces acidicola]|uniref:amidohydrolase family protein n=1 Tax=Streptomyces acidicola TaxID=2596892 RepID=UPI0037F7AC65
MKVIALEEHFTTRAMLEANADHPLLTMLRSAGAPEQGAVGGEMMLRLTDLGEHRLAVMDSAGIDVQVLSQATPGPEELPAAKAVHLAAHANDVIAEAIAAHPSRFAGFAALPMRDPVAAAKELDRTVQQLGFVGTMINSHVGGRYLDEPFFWPLFEAAEALDVPIYLHPNRPPQPVVDSCYSGFSPIVTETLATTAWGWHIDTGLHALRLIIGGVFDRFPGLQIIIGHLGEGLTSMLWRADSTLNRVAGLPKPVRDYFSEHFSITISGFLDDVAFAAAIDTVGTDRVMFSVDYPFLGSAETRAYLDQLPLSQSDKEKIAHANAERLLKLS